MTCRLNAALLLILPGFLLGVRPAAAQTDGVLQINSEIHAFLQKQQALGHLPDANLEHLPLSVGEAREILGDLEARDSLLSDGDRELLDRYLHGAQSPASLAVQRIVPAAYANGIDLFSFRGEGYGVQINPLVYAEYGRAFRSLAHGRGRNSPAWQYARGVRLSGHIGRYFFFESRLTESRARPVRFEASDRTAPRLGAVLTDDGVYEYFEAEAVVGIRTTHVEVRFGREESRWGPGRGSLFLSNYASPYEQLQIRAGLGAFRYASTFAGLTERRFARAVDVAIPRKYAAFHRLSFDVVPELTLSVAESVIFSTDTLGARRGFDLSYLNPIIFYRAVEHERGSPDNVMLSGSAAWRPMDGLEVYGELLLDELRISAIGDGWWGNKWAWMLGVFAVPIDELVIRLEYARLRPYLYAHRAPGSDYVHYNDVLGHPAGPNSIDLSVFADYRPQRRVRVALDASYTMHGRNAEDANYGGDPLESYQTRVSDTDVWLLQGVRQNLFITEVYGGYEVLPGLWFEAALRYHALDDKEKGLDRWIQPFAIMRWGSPYRSLRF